MLTLTSALQNTIRLHGGKRAIVDAETELTWRQYGDGIARAAGLLRQLGVSPGRRFAILGRNSWRQAELIYAGYWCAAVPVPINHRLAPREIAGILEDADCALLALDPAFAGLLQSSEFAGWGERVLSLQAELYDQRKSLALPLAMVEAEEDQDALMLYTGGTTGGGKGVRLSHRNIVANALQIMHVMSPHQSDVYLHATPMFHAAEVKSTIFTMFGAAHAYLPEFTPRKFLAAIEDYRVTVAGLVPTTILRLLDEPEREGFDSSSLRLISYGTSPIQPPLIRRTMAAFPGVGLQQCYGLTECSPYVAMLDEEAHRRGLAGHEQLLSSAGRPLPGTDLRIQDDDGNEVASGQVGEVVVRGPQVSRGYHKRPQEQVRSFRDDGFHTGDIGWLDEDGFLYLLDRRNDVVISGGENVYTREVKEILGRHPGVHEVSVIGVPDAEYGEALMAVVVPLPSWTPSEDELIEHCRPLIGGFKIPRRLAFVDALPKNAMGKVRKQDLRKTYAAEVRGQQA
ncbi:MAG TPA: AMP-binding protein [Alphaproteobacteria bacterium]|nr:AMP-binding protein [Alphaproteobacteria bacterium]HJM51845.1 AMP-binding protein [Alphaproteobacteria bacterium]